jgi:hypothetical protein
MSSWTRRTCSALLLGAALLCVPGCEGPAAELALTLERGADATLTNVTSLRFIVREFAQPAPEVFGPVEIDRSRPMRLSAQVTPGVDFYVDIWGCESNDRCVPEAVLARGCTPALNVQSDTSVTVELFDVGAPELTVCPPAAP